MSETKLVIDLLVQSIRVCATFCLDSFQPSVDNSSAVPTPQVCEHYISFYMILVDQTNRVFHAKAKKKKCVFPVTRPTLATLKFLLAFQKK